MKKSTKDVMLEVRNYLAVKLNKSVVSELKCKGFKLQYGNGYHYDIVTTNINVSLYTEYDYFLKVPSYIMEVTVNKSGKTYRHDMRKAEVNANDIINVLHDKFKLPR